MDITVLDTLVLVAFALLVVVTGGIAYLTASEWRDRRRQDREKRAAKSVKPTKSAKPAKPAKPAKQK